jgi:precorrin-6B methylase 1
MGTSVSTQPKVNLANKTPTARAAVMPTPAQAAHNQYIAARLADRTAPLKKKVYGRSFASSAPKKSTLVGNQSNIAYPAVQVAPGVSASQAAMAKKAISMSSMTAKKKTLLQK